MLSALQYNEIITVNCLLPTLKCKAVNLPSLNSNNLLLTCRLVFAKWFYKAMWETMWVDSE